MGGVENVGARARGEVDGDGHYGRCDGGGAAGDGGGCASPRLLPVTTRELP